jgi:hypothetical protein
MALALIAASCGEDRLSARETEEVFKKNAPSALNVRCRDTKGSWDYICSYDYRFMGRLEHSTISVRVNSSRITARTAP